MECKNLLFIHSQIIMKSIMSYLTYYNACRVLHLCNFGSLFNCWMYYIHGGSSHSEVFKMYTQRIKYFRDWTNYIDLILYISSIIFASSLSEECLCVRDYKWQFGTVATFLSWIDFLLFIRILPCGMFKCAKKLQLSLYYID